MKVGVDITQAVKHGGRGIARYIRELAPRLAAPGLNLQLTHCVRSERWLQRARVNDFVPGSTPRWLPLSSWMSAPGLELFHSFGNHLPAISAVPLSLTVHDFRSLDQERSSGAGARLRRNIQRADGILCLTEHGRSRLLHYFPNRDTEQVAVVPHGVDHQVFRPQDPAKSRLAARKLGIEQPFLIQLGSWFPHKNLELSISAFALSRARKEGYRLVLAGGGARPDYLRVLRAHAQQEGVAHLVHWIEHINDPDLPLVLSAASALLQPSRYEGFALPILEAMASGLPGVVSDSSCLPEVSGGVWPIRSQFDPEHFATGIDTICLEPEYRKRTIEQGLEYSAQFTWERSARKTAGFFSRLQHCHRALWGLHGQELA